MPRFKGFTFGDDTSRRHMAAPAVDWRWEDDMAGVESIFDQEPQGFYPLSEAAWLAGLRPQRLAGWVRLGYASASQSSSPPYLFSYQDIAEAMLIHELLSERNVPWKQVRDTIEGLHADFDRWPLSRESLRRSLTTIRDPHVTRSSLVVGSGEDACERRGTAWQRLLNPDVLGLITSRLSRGGWAVVLEPGLTHIAIDPSYLSGRPTIRGRRISAVDVAEIAATDEGRIALEDEYQLSPEEIDDAAKWWSAARRLPAAA